MSKITTKRFRLFNVDERGVVDVFSQNKVVVILIMLKVKAVGLIYDLQTRLKKAFIKAHEEALELRKTILEECSIKKKIKFKNDNEIETFLKIVDVKEAVGKMEKALSEMRNEKASATIIKSAEENVANYKKLLSDKGLDELSKPLLIDSIDGEKVKGRKVLGDEYDIKDPAEWNKRFNEFLDGEIELDCNQIRLSKLDAEDVGNDLRNIIDALDDFIVDDRENKK